MPIIKLSNCKSLKDGIYKDFNTIYCFTDELDFCINDLKKSLEMELDELIQDAENHV